MKKIRIGVFSTSRAEFGILNPLLQEFKKNKKFKLNFFAGGTHFLKYFGNTHKEIEKQKIKIDDKFGFKFYKDDLLSVSKNLSLSTLKLGKIFSKFNFDYVCILGDRYELLPIILTSIITNTKIIHIGGGETTLLSIDEHIRNMISQASNIHFTINKKFSHKLELMGIHKKNIYCVGSLAVENILKIKKENKNKIFKRFNLNPQKKLAIFTYHPVTLEFRANIKKQINEIFDALDKFDYQILITSPNLESNSQKIKKTILERIYKKNNYKYFNSLGFKNYHKILNFTDFVIGNSSSGIVEAPYYKIPTINIGKRQKDRLKHPSVIDVGCNTKKIANTIKLTQSKSFLKRIKKQNYKFGNGNASKQITKIIYKNYLKLKTNH